MRARDMLRKIPATVSNVGPELSDVAGGMCLTCMTAGGAQPGLGDIPTRRAKNASKAKKAKAQRQAKRARKNATRAKTKLRRSQRAAKAVCE